MIRFHLLNHLEKLQLRCTALAILCSWYQGQFWPWLQCHCLALVPTPTRQNVVRTMLVPMTILALVPTPIDVTNFGTNCRVAFRYSVMFIKIK